MKILVTGGTGNVGSKVCKELSKKDIRVVAASRTNDEELCNDNISHVVFDFDAPSTYDQAIEGVDLIVLISPVFSSNLDQKVISFIHYVRSKGINNFVFLSIMHAGMATASWLVNIEEELKKIDCVYSVVRSNILMEAFTNGFVSGMIKVNKMITLPGGDGEISLISSSDVAKFIAKISLNLEKYNGHVHTITGGRSISFEEISEVITKHSEEPVPFKNISPSELKKLGEDHGIPQEITNILLILFGASTLGLLAKVTKDYHKILGSEPTCFDSFYAKHKLEENHAVIN